MGRGTIKTRRRAVAVANSLLSVVAALGLWACAATNPPASRETAPVNYVEVSERLVTSGRLTAKRISELNPAEYRLVINLAPGGGDSDFPEEAGLLTDKGISYVAIPVEIEQPDYQDFVLFSSVLDAVGNGRVWIHCQVNYRASMFTFLYRVIHEGGEPDSAYEKVTQVWVPTPHWLRFARETLAKHDIVYDF